LHAAGKHEIANADGFGSELREAKAHGTVGAVAVGAAEENYGNGLIMRDAKSFKGV
jgi:hypothetical protein